MLHVHLDSHIFIILNLPLENMPYRHFSERQILGQRDPTSRLALTIQLYTLLILPLKAYLKV